MSILLFSEEFCSLLPPFLQTFYFLLQKSLNISALSLILCKLGKNLNSFSFSCVTWDIAKFRNQVLHIFPDGTSSRFLNTSRVRRPLLQKTGSSTDHVWFFFLFVWSQTNLPVTSICWSYYLSQRPILILHSSQIFGRNYDVPLNLLIWLKYPFFSNCSSYHIIQILL